jgi:hypothetical protein
VIDVSVGTRGGVCEATILGQEAAKGAVRELSLAELRSGLDAASADQKEGRAPRFYGWFDLVFLGLICEEAIAYK